MENFISNVLFCWGLCKNSNKFWYFWFSERPWFYQVWVNQIKGWKLPSRIWSSTTSNPIEYLISNFEETHPLLSQSTPLKNSFKGHLVSRRSASSLPPFLTSILRPTQGIWFCRPLYPFIEVESLINPDCIMNTSYDLLHILQAENK